MSVDYPLNPDELRPKIYKAKVDNQRIDDVIGAFAPQ